MVRGIKKFIRRVWRNTVFYLFYLCGFVYTVYVVYDNVSLYFQYKSTNIQTSLDDKHNQANNQVFQS